jgi:aspartyl aminopeptidase
MPSISLRDNGFENLQLVNSLAPGQKIYEVNRDRTISLFVIGREALVSGLHIVGAHIDSPRLELKGRPLYEDNGFALFQTNFMVVLSSISGQICRWL